MEKSSNKEILTKVEEIVELIQSSSQYQDYLFLEKKMKEHSRIPKIINQIKSLQKKAVRFEYENRDITSIQSELDLLQRQLEDIPLYQDFLRVQGELNSFYVMIKQTLDQLFMF